MNTATSYAKSPPSCDEGPRPCAPVPEFRRLNYTHGQILGAADFQAEQRFFHEKQRLHNRCLHGYGVVCGLLVQPLPAPQDCAPQSGHEVLKLREDLADAQGALDDAKDADEQDVLKAEIEKLEQALAAHPAAPCVDPVPARISIDCGLALDCEGNELVVRRPLSIDLWEALDASERKLAGSKAVTVFVSLCYCEQPVDPFRPVFNDQCSAQSACAYGKVRESVSVHVSLNRPEPDTRCDSCCTPCANPCLLLAAIHGFRRGRSLDPQQVDNSARRRIGTYESAVITGINWVHGASYQRSDVNAILGTASHAGGLEIHFSRPVRVDTLGQQGVVELWRIEGGGGRSAYISQIRGHCHPINEQDGLASGFRYRQTDRETPDYGDRIVILIRCVFILDACCRPVDGAHVGGRVPLLPDSLAPLTRDEPDGCALPPWGYGPWTSGNGSPGSNFESWIVVSEHDDPPEPDSAHRAQRGATS